MSIDTVTWVQRYDGALGFIPEFIDPHDNRGAKEQINERYAHGGGWFEFERFELVRPDPDDPRTWALLGEGDPPVHSKGYAKLRDEWIVVFDHDWTIIVQPDGSFNCARLD